MKDVSWLTVNGPTCHINCGPSELDEFKAACDAAGYEMEWSRGATEWGADAMRGTRIA